MHRTIKRADIWASYMALCKLCRPSDIFSDIIGVVRALSKGEVDCIGAWHNAAELWDLVWNKVHECIEEDLNMRVFWTQAHTTLEEKAKMTPRIDR